MPNLAVSVDQGGGVPPPQSCCICAEYCRLAEAALTKAAEVLTEDNPDRRPDDELARTWAALGQGWATLSHADVGAHVIPQV